MSNDAHPVAPSAPETPTTESATPSLPSPSPETLSLLALNNVVVYPLAAMPLRVSQPRAVRLVEDAILNRTAIGAIAARSNADEPSAEDIYRVGTTLTIARHFKSSDGTYNLLVQGGERFRVLEVVSETPYLFARVELMPETWESSLEVEALQRSLKEAFQRIAELRGDMPEELLAMVLGIEEPRQLTYTIATYTRMSLESAQHLLEMEAPGAAKMRYLLQVLNREIELLELGRKIQAETQSELERSQREHFLREQLRTIQRELGEDEQSEINALREKILAAGMNPEAEREALRELDRLAQMPPMAPEYSVIRTYLDWMVSLPWQTVTQDNLDIAHARRVLDEDHYGLKDVKERILEFLAVRKRRQELAQEAQLSSESDDEELAGSVAEETQAAPLRREREGVILCFIGPPGVGKTSLGASIARAMGRRFIRMSVGGVHDEAEIRGFRRTYIGAMPGRIIQSIRRAGSRNPVFMIDEVDKIGADYRGDPASALLEVLDPEQNFAFHDHYLDVPFDLSQTMFICTANTLETIPGPLRDRMEVLHLSGYTEREKLAIAQGYLVPRQIKENGLLPEEVCFDDEAILKIIREYTREAGVRNLEREIGSICRKLVTRYQEGRVTFPVCVTPELVRELLGKARYYNEIAERTDLPGVATGLSWTPFGGEIIFVEATQMPGNKNFLLTGQLGDVMKESAQAALSYVRSHAEALGIDPRVFEKSDLHVHVPAGAQPKDGPSAGVTIVTALASLLSGRRVRPDVAMTGEITLRGSVLPVGGIKEKVLAAHRAGIKTVILPKRNEPDLEDLPEDVRQGLSFVLVDRVQQVLDAALMPPERRRARRRRAA
ncbi:MAG: endopeptidase La [Anaerolineae bacterium]|nr:endopeptidase La [Thermoflexales bacterium]MDW8054617.1 endopeptidase La [Anaerolineae bacterium]